MSEKKTNEERQAEVDRQLELMKAVIGDDNFSDSDDSDSDDDSQELRERSNKNAAMESAREFLWGEAEDDEDVMLGGPFPKQAPSLAPAESTQSQSRASGSSVGMFGASIFGRGGGMEVDGLDHNSNLMDATEARGRTAPLKSTDKTRPSLSNMFLRGSNTAASSWNDAGARDSEEFLVEDTERTSSYMASLGGAAMWMLTLALFGIYGYYVYDFATSLHSSKPTAVDVDTPTTSTDEAIRQALLDAGIAVASTLDDPESPQNAAFQWITKDGISIDDQYLGQRYSLAVLYYSTDGSFWSKSDGWLSKDGYCQWYGVQCLGTDALIEQGNNNGPVFELNLSSNKLRGNIPAELTAFKDLFFLDFQDNQLEGTIPNELGGWTGLRMFSIAHNELYGSIPKTLLSTSPDLHILNAGHNKFSGSLPEVMGQVTSLREVRLEYNDLGGTIPDSYHALDRLETLHLAGNKLEGSLSHAVYDMDRLETLYLHDNALSGKLSTEFAKLSHLELLTLNHNKLVGTVPDVFSKTRFLQELHLHGNEFTGTMPHSVCKLTTEHKLTYLSVDCTKTDAAGELGVHCDCCTNCM